MTHAQHATARLPTHGKCLNQQIVRRFAGRQAFTEPIRLLSQFGVGHRLVLRFQSIDRGNGGIELFEIPGIGGSKQSSQGMLKPPGNTANEVAKDFPYSRN